MKNIEIERKYICKDFQNVKKILREKGFKKVGEKNQEDTYFLVGHRNKKGNRTYLRIRRDLQKESVSVDYHEVISDDKTVEMETKVSGYNVMKYILNKLGLSIQCIVRKNRKVYKKSNVKVMLDNVEELSKFVEIEIAGEKPPIQEIQDLLQLKEKDRIQKEGYCDLLIKDNQNEQDILK